MKKILLLIIGALLVYQSTDINSYAVDECTKPIIDLGKLDFSRISSGDSEWDTQKQFGKQTEILRYESIPLAYGDLKSKLKRSAVDYVRAWNSEISYKNVIEAAKLVASIGMLKNGIDSQKLIDSMEKLQSLFVNDGSLSDEEITLQIDGIKENLNKAVMRGQAEFKRNVIKDGAYAGLSYLGAKAVLGGLQSLLSTAGTVATTAVEVATEAATAVKVATASTAWSSILSSVASGIPVAVGLAVFGYLLYKQDKNIIKEEKTAEYDFYRNLELCNEFERNIRNHEWLDKNILIMSKSTVPTCVETNLMFAKIPDVKYENWDRICEDVAKVKCESFKDNTVSCWKKVLDEIKCILKGESHSSCIKDDSEYMSMLPQPF